MRADRPVTVAIVNDYELVVAGVAALLAPYADRVRVVELDTGLPVRSDVDVVLYDTFGQVQGDSLDLDSLVADGSAKVVIFSWNTQPELVRRLDRAGRVGVPRRRAWPPRSWWPRSRPCTRADRAAAGLGGDGRDPGRTAATPAARRGLTEREAEIIALITQGLSNQEIAERSYLSINSIKTYIRSAYQKMGVTRRSQAVLWGVQHGFEPDVLRRVQR